MSTSAPSLIDVRERWLDQRALFLCLLGLAALFTHLAPTTNDAVRYALSLSLARHGTIAIDDTLFELIEPQYAEDRAEYDGHIFSDKGPLSSFVGVPAAFLGDRVLQSPRLGFFLTSLLIAALPFALIGVELHGLALRAGHSRRSALALALGFCLGTNLFFYATLMFSHSLSAWLVLKACLLLRQRRSLRSAAGAGLLAGLAVANDFYLLALLPLLGLVVLCAERRRFLPLVGGAVAAGLLLMGYLTWAFDHPLTLPHAHHARFADLHTEGLYGLSGFSPGALWLLLFSLGYGLFVYNPSLWLAPLATRRAWRRDRAAVVVAWGSVAALAALVASLGHGLEEHAYGLAVSWGPRYLVPALPLLAALVVLGPRALPRAAWGLLGASVLLNATIVAISFLPEPYQGMRFLLSGGDGLLTRSGGLSLLGQLNLMRGWELPALLVAGCNIALCAAPVVWLARRMKEGSEG